MIAVQKLVELLDLPQDLLPHQIMEQFAHGTAKQTAEVLGTSSKAFLFQGGGEIVEQR